MSQSKAERPSLNIVLKQLLLPLFIMVCLLLLSWTEPALNTIQIPYEQLNSPLTEWALWFSDSGHFPGVVFIALFFLLIFLSQRRFNTRKLNTKKRMVIAAYITAFSIIFAGAGAWFNEYIVKESLQQPRPNIIYLAGENGHGLLGMTATEFYQGSKEQTRTKSQRSDILKLLLNNNSLKQHNSSLSLSTEVHQHWIMETGYSFPSGHSFAALFFASFFLALGFGCLSGWRKSLFYLLVPWAIAVCYSRIALRVHTPLDITIGGLEGLIFGIMAFVLLYSKLKKLL